MRKTTLLQCVYEDEMAHEFDLNTWVCVSIKIKSHCWRNRSPLAAKVIGGVLKDNLDERHWRTLLKVVYWIRIFINSILRLSHIVLPKHLQNCPAFCCMLPQDQEFDKDDLVRIWIALGFIPSSSSKKKKGKRWRILEKGISIFWTRNHLPINIIIITRSMIYYLNRHDSFLYKNALESLGMKNCFLIILETIRHLSVDISNLKVLKRIEKFK
ncbi:hypothetical protein IEQ34_004499 [Dendrobium chrysotoxum]|uniref:Disease resistance protein winged helix domain-containing protein n=1 Tax=Dendrobium chrysotoxum TaxID=161865 RepID=A0AAV7HE71_DENCH|nr:hypothetical protein IEQ34_004499 [Dendrobium chrysotoxum]